MDLDRRTTILIADPDRTVFESAAQALLADPSSERGYEVVYARDGDEALRSIHVLRPDVVLVARDLPGIDGATLVRTFALSPVHADRPFVGLVRAGDGDSAGVMREAGVEEVIAKPFDAASLRARVQEILLAARSAAEERRRKAAASSREARRPWPSARLRGYERN